MNNKNEEISNAARLIGLRGGQKTKANHGKDYYANLSKMGIAARKRNKKNANINSQGKSQESKG